MKTGVLKGTVSSNLTASAFIGNKMYPKFFQTMMGRSFFEGQVPRLIKAIEKLACELQRYNDAQESKESEGKK